MAGDDGVGVHDAVAPELRAVFDYGGRMNAHERLAACEIPARLKTNERVIEALIGPEL
jgi:hypothetical protein